MQISQSLQSSRLAYTMSLRSTSSFSSSGVEVRVSASRCEGGGWIADRRGVQATCSRFFPWRRSFIGMGTE